MIVRLGRVLALFYGPHWAVVLVYMLQGVEYRAVPYLRWFWRTRHFNRVMYRRSLLPTRAARYLVAAIRAGMVAQVGLGLGLGVAAIFRAGPGSTQLIIIGLLLWLTYPLVWAHVVLIPLTLARWLIVAPRERRLIRRAGDIFKNFSGPKIMIVGSFGKTSMKELLATILREGKQVAATPANRNVMTSHAVFAAHLSGAEEILIIECGEGAPGDVARFAEFIKPTHVVVTGLAPAHLDRYADVQAAGQDIFTAAEAVPPEHVFVNISSQTIQPFVKPSYRTFGSAQALGWRTKDISVTVTGTGFTLQKGKRAYRMHSGLLGQHQVGPLAMAAVLGMELGLTIDQVKTSITRTVPFEHRMQPYRLNGAWIIDDTYNGTLEGIRAGTELLAGLPAKRKTYVTPGLVDQGQSSEAIHRQVGQLIAAAAPDKVILMRNSTTPAIRQGLDEAGYKAALTIEADPLRFYQNLQEYVAAGDLVVLQNDWTDNYT